MDFTNRVEVAEHLKHDLGYKNYEFLTTDIPFPNDEKSYQHFIHTIRFIDSAIADYEQNRKE